MFSFSRNSLDKLKSVHPDLRIVALRALALSDIDFGISQGVRTQIEQDTLYEQGRTRPGKVVTWTKKSDHLRQADGYGHAIDIVVFIGGKAIWDEYYYLYVSKYFKQAAKELNVELDYGGDWNIRKDYPHYSIKVKQNA